MPPSIAVVVCHYNPTKNFFLRSMAMLCVSSILRNSDSDIRVILCDGSPEVDLALSAELSRNQVVYLHAGKKLSFGETYNMGIKKSTEEYVVLVANDIQITSKKIKMLVHEIKENVACTIPYLTHADYLTQINPGSEVPHICFPSSMTLNVNAFKRDTLEAIGYVPEELSGAFNDVVMFSRMRELGYRIGLVNVGTVYHFGQATLSVSTNVRWADDIKVAAKLLSNLLDEKKMTNYTPRNYLEIYSKSAQMIIPKMLWKIVSALPLKPQQTEKLASLVARLEPYVSIDSDGFSRGMATLGFGKGKS